MFDTPGEAGAQLSEAVLDVLVLAASTAADLHVDALGDHELCEVLTRLDQVQRRLDAARGHALAALHDRGTTDRDEGLSTARWSARETGVPVRLAAQRLHVAQQLRDVLPLVDAALTAGEISYEHARVLARATNERNAEAMAAASELFITCAGSMVFAAWRRKVVGFAALMDPDGPHDPDDVSRNRLTLSASGGFMLLRGELTGDDALLVEAAVDQVADELFRRAVRDHETSGGELTVPDRATLRALALVELCRRGLATELCSTRPPRTELTLHAHITEPGEAVADPARWWITDGHGVPLPTALADRLVCHATTRTLTLDPDGRPLTLGRAQHDPTPSQRRALAARDGGCSFPGCGAPVTWADAHHVEPWPAGPTSLGNLVLLCRHHHRVAHRRGWTLVLGPDGWARWCTPQGRRFWGQRHHRSRAGPVTE